MGLRKREENGLHERKYAALLDSVEDCPQMRPDDSAQPPSHKLSQEALDLFPSLKKVLDWKDLSAVQVHETKHDYDLSDRIEDVIYKTWPFPYPSYLYRRMSVGPAQMQLQQIDELKHQYNQQLQTVQPLTTGGAQRLIAAYLTREMQRLDQRQYATDAPANPRADEDLSTQKRFEGLQSRWDAARQSHNASSLRRLLLESYNVGAGNAQVNRIDKIKSHLDEYLPKCSF